MALLNCPECGKEISDKSKTCIHCGYPLKGEAAEVGNNFNTDSDPLINQDSSNEIEYKKKNKKEKIKIRAIILVILLFGVITAIILGSGIIGNRLDVNEITLSKWRLIDESNYSDDYEGIVTSNETKPFVAVIGYYQETSMSPMFIYMENGKGIIQTSELSDEDPSIKYTAIGYMNGRILKESEVSSIKYKDTDYNDWSDDTSCIVNIEIEMKSKVDGLLFVDLKNDLTNDVRKGVPIAIADGKAEYTYYLANLPLKSRGVDVMAVPKFFCDAKGIKETDYIIETPFSVEKKDGSYSTSFSGKVELAFSEYQDGIIIYTEELLDGGRKEDRSEVITNVAYLEDSQCIISTYTWGKNEDKILTPTYDIRVIGYLKWDELDK